MKYFRTFDTPDSYQNFKSLTKRKVLSYHPDAPGEHVHLDTSDYEIYYTTTNGQKITLSEDVDFGSEIVEHDYLKYEGNISFEDKPSTIPSGAFAEKETLKEIVIPSDVDTIESGAFENCENLDKITIKGEDVTVEQGAFAGVAENGHLIVENREMLKDETIVDELIGWGGYDGDGKFVEKIGVHSFVISANGPGSLTINANMGLDKLVYGDGECEMYRRASKDIEKDGVHYYCYEYDGWFVYITDNTYGTYPANTIVYEYWYYPSERIEFERMGFGDTEIDGEMYYMYGEGAFVKELKSSYTSNDIYLIDWDDDDNLMAIPFDDISEEFSLNFIGYDSSNDVMIFESTEEEEWYSYECGKNGFEIVEGEGKIKEQIINYDRGENQTIEVKQEIFSIYPNLDDYDYNKTLTKIEIPESVTSIGDYTFRGCTGLISIEIPESVTSIGNSAFYNCSNLTSINIPSSVTSIGHSAFDGCSKLANVNISDGVTSIGNQAFYNCSNLTSINIPSSVTSIEYGLFSFCSSLVNIVVDSNNTIYDSRDNCNAIIETATNTLLYGCNSTVIPSSVTSIGSKAFFGSGITSIEIPANIINFNERVFSECKKLTSVKFLKSSSLSLGQYSFSDCTSLSEIITFRDLSCSNTTFMNVKPNGTLYCRKGYEGEIDSLLRDGEWYLKYYNWTYDHILPDDRYIVRVENINVETNPIYANTPSISVSFRLYDNVEQQYSYTMNVNIPENTTGSTVTRTVSVTKLGYTFDVEYTQNGTMKETSFIRLKFSNNNYQQQFIDNISSIQSTWYDVNDESIIINYSKPYTICDDGYLNLNFFGVVAYGVGYIDSGTRFSIFMGLNESIRNNITEVVLPNTYTIIVDNAFYHCSNLTSVNIPDGVTYIGNLAFDGCSSLTSVNIPSSVTSIGEGAFDGCSSLTSVNIPSSVTFIGDYTFRGCTGLISIEIPESVTSIGEYTFRGCTGLISIEIPESVTYIGNSAFYNCSNLTSINIPSSVTSIGHSAFDGCSSLTSVNIPNSVISIGSYAFYDVPHIEYHGDASGAPWGANSMN